MSVHGASTRGWCIVLGAGLRQLERVGLQVNRMPAMMVLGLWESTGACREVVVGCSVRVRTFSVQFLS